jgi:hypothetical protein
LIIYPPPWCVRSWKEILWWEWIHWPNRNTVYQ